jgi:hypothetical protein
MKIIYDHKEGVELVRALDWEHAQLYSWDLDWCSLKTKTSILIDTKSWKIVYPRSTFLFLYKFVVNLCMKLYSW